MAAFASSPARSITSLLDTAPERMTASSVTDTLMSSPGNSCWKFCCSVGDARIDDHVVVLSLGGAPHDQADGAGALAVDQDLARLDHHGVGHRRIGHGNAGDVEFGDSTVDRPAVSSTRSATSGWPGSAARASRVDRAVSGDQRRGKCHPPQTAPRSSDYLCRALRGANRLDHVDLRRWRGGGGRRPWRSAAAAATATRLRAAARPRPSARRPACPWSRSVSASSGLRSVSVIRPTDAGQRDALGVGGRDEQGHDRGGQRLAVLRLILVDLGARREHLRRC